MPIKVPNNLPAVDILTKENVFVMTDTRAVTQDIRPLQILILNLMPTKIETETQLTRLLGNSPLQVELELLQTKTHKASNVSEEHMIAFYKTFDQISSRYYDGMIITGAPVELMEFEEVEYWDELCEIMEWANSHVHSIFYICWGAQAGLYYNYGIKKQLLPKKLSGVYKHTLEYKTGMLFRGFDDEFYVPHSRNTTVDEEAVFNHPDLRVISTSPDAGIFAVKSKDDKHIFIMGHSEYDPDTLRKEYERDVKAGINPEIPCNYFPDDDPSKDPTVIWRSCANLLYSNWLNYFVYQSTPFDLNAISTGATPAHELVTDEFDLIAAKFGGSSLATGDKFEKVRDIILSEPRRRFIVVSAPGKRSEEDEKITDTLLRINREEVPRKREELLNKVKNRFKDIESYLLDSLAKEYAKQEAFTDRVSDDGLRANFPDNPGDRWNIDLDIEFSDIERVIGGAGGTPSQDVHDYIASRGEYLNAKLLAAYLGFDFVDAENLIMFDSDGKYDADATEEKLRAELLKHDRAVIPGFYGSLPNGRVETFTRGGSDITGSIVAAAVNADMYENWTDVSGLLMADPELVPEPVTVPVITYRELREMAYLGAEVMHPDAIFPVISKDIPIRICNTNAPEDAGSLIVKNARYYADDSESANISGISGRQNFTAITVQKPNVNEDPRSREIVLKVFSDKNIKVGNIISGIDTLTLIIDEAELNSKAKGSESGQDWIQRELSIMLKDAEISQVCGLSLIGVVGRDIGNSPAIAIKILSALAAMHINVRFIDHGTGNMNMMIAVDNSDYEKSVKAIYQQFA